MSELVMEHSVASYIESLTGETPQEIAELVFQSIKHFEDFMSEFWRKEMSPLLDILTYREHLVRSENVSLEAFNQRCIEHTVCTAVTMTFYQPLPLNDVSFLNERIESKGLASATIYEQLSNNINLSLYKIIL